MFPNIRSDSRISPFTSVAPVLLAAGMLIAVGGAASHAAESEPAATGKTAAVGDGEWTVAITPAGRASIGRTDEFASADGPIITPARNAAPTPPPTPEPPEGSDAVAVANAVEIGETVAVVSSDGAIVETDGPAVALPVRYRSYRDAYRAIPFSRAEYLANPSYRHDSAMELLFGKMRPTVIHRHVTQLRPVRTVAAFSPYYYRSPLFDYSRGPYSRYAGLFGYRGGYRPQYYFGGSYGAMPAPYHAY